MGNVLDWHQVPVIVEVPGSRRLTALRYALCMHLQRPHRRHRPACGPSQPSSPFGVAFATIPANGAAVVAWASVLASMESSTSSWCCSWHWWGRGRRPGGYAIGHG